MPKRVKTQITQRAEIPKKKYHEVKKKKKMFCVAVVCVVVVCVVAVVGHFFGSHCECVL